MISGGENTYDTFGTARFVLLAFVMNEAEDIDEKIEVFIK